MGKSTSDMDKGVDGGYETFDSGAGVLIPSQFKGDFDHNDSDGKLGDSPSGEIVHGAVPEMPSVKR